QQHAFWPAIEFARGVQKPPHLLGRGGWRAIAKVQMHANSQLRILPCCHNPRVKRPPVGQQRCAGHQTLAVGLHDPPVHPFRPSQVIRIDDQIPHFCFSPVLSIVAPVLSDSYSYASVPLTLLSCNSSMINKTVSGTALLLVASRLLLAATCARSMRLSPQQA